ncbi:hypothetical protein ACQEVF_45740 [Nonomuraea polychroma]|uniref:hypothetical protein n=1 Tax=Nonomuraea polychroma TaxID=46176 RepID=UPI003D8C1FB6
MARVAHCLRMSVLSAVLTDRSTDITAFAASLPPMSTSCSSRRRISRITASVIFVPRTSLPSSRMSRIAGSSRDTGSSCTSWAA